MLKMLVLFISVPGLSEEQQAPAVLSLPALFIERPEDTLNDTVR